VRKFVAGLSLLDAGRVKKTRLLRFKIRKEFIINRETKSTQKNNNCSSCRFYLQRVRVCTAYAGIARFAVDLYTELERALLQIDLSLQRLTSREII